MNNEFNIIKTKLIPPVPRKNYIKRDKLINELNNICDYRVVIVKGAAASGKSTLVSSFIQDLNNVKWINLDEDNNNLYSFWYYFIEAVSEYLEEDADEIKNTIGSMVSKDEIFNILIYLINKMPEEDIYIIFDDYHNITEKFINSSVEYLIKYSPANVHYIFITREEFPIYLGELRARGEILKIGEDELKFSRNECVSFVRDTLKLDINDEIINKIFNMSEGWIGGIQFASLALKNKKDISEKNINILNKYFIEYLTQEILNTLDGNEREFIVKTSVLKFFNAELCDFILDIHNSEEIINSLIDKNLFIIAVNENEHIYRYHHLFKEFLNINFESMAEDEKRQIYISAYTFLKDQGDINEGIKQLIKAKEYDKAVLEIENNIRSMECWQYMNEIPLQYLLKSDELIIQRIFYHFSKMEISECESLVDILKKSENNNLRVIANTFSMFFYYNGKIDDLDLKAVEEAKLSDLTKAIIYLNACTLLLNHNEFKIIDYAKKSDKIGERYNMPHVRIFAKFIMASFYELMGEYEETVREYENIKKIIDKNKFLNNFMFTYYLGIAGIYMKRYEIGKAEEYIRLAEPGLRFNIPAMRGSIIYNMMEIQFLKGNIEEGKKIAENMMDEYDAGQSFARLNMFTGELRYIVPMRHFEKDELIKYKELYEKELKGNTSLMSVDDEIIYCRAIYILGEHEKAMKLLNKSLEYCRKYSIKTDLIEGLIIKALMLSENYEKNKRDMFNLLNEALFYSCENGYMKAFVIEGERLLKIIRQMKNDKNTELTSAQNLFIERFTEILEPSQADEDSILSEREKEVLSAVSEGCSNKEIGDRLNISLATVKSHMINIYSKLDVSNRVMAIEKARGLKIIK